MTRITALAAALALGCAPAAFAATASGQLINGRQQFVDANGAPLAGGAVHVYLPGTTTPATTYQDPGLQTANTWPIVLDANGTASIWTPPGTYREVVQDSLGDTLFDQTASTTDYASALTPGATIAASGDVSCTATPFTGASAITLPCTVVSASTAAAGKVQLATPAVAQAGVSASQAVTPAALASVVQGQTMAYAADTSGAANTITLNPTPALSALAIGQRLNFKLANTTTGAVTVNTSGLGAVALYAGGSAVGAGLVAGKFYTIAYDGAHWQLASSAPGCSGGSCWEIDPGGLWKEWGGATVAGSSSVPATLPVTCPTVAPISANATGTIAQANAVQITSVSTTSITIQNSGGGSGTVYWSVVCY
jgi:hypothetical protein